MKRKTIVSGPIHGELVEGADDRGPGKPVLRGEKLGNGRHRGGTKTPPPASGVYDRGRGRR
jgi:hypothetical protein